MKSGQAEKILDKHIGSPDSHKLEEYEWILPAMEEYLKPYKKALKLIKNGFPDEVLSDQLGEDWPKIEKLIKNIK